MKGKKKVKVSKEQKKNVIIFFPRMAGKNIIYYLLFYSLSIDFNGITNHSRGKKHCLVTVLTNTLDYSIGHGF